MWTGSRPRTSSTRTSRIWRASAPRVCSSSKTVGSVRTGIPRWRHSRTILRAGRAGSGGDRDDHFVGLGVVEDPGQVLFGVAAHAHAVDPQPALGVVVVEEADRREAELAVAHDLAGDPAPALAGAGDQDGPLALAA